MKVTALIPDDLVNEVKQYAGGSNLTESLIVALQEWLSLKKIKSLNNEIKNNILFIIRTSFPLLVLPG